MQYGLQALIVIVAFASAFSHDPLSQPSVLVDDEGQTRFQFTFNGKAIKFAIQPNLRWRSSTYRSMIMTDDEGLIDHPDSADSGHWRLSDLDDGRSGVRHATISADHGRISALISMMDSITIHISPVNSTHHNIHTHEEPPDEHLLHERPEQLPRHGKQIQFKRIFTAPNYNCSLTKPTKYVEVLIVNDFSRYDMLTNWTTSHTNAIVNMADGYYAAASFDTCVRLVLIGQLTFQSRVPEPITYRPCNTSSSEGNQGCFSCTDDGKCEMTSVRPDQYDSTALLRSFRQWRMNNAELLKKKFGSFDAVHLFSGRDFDGQVRGLAYLDTICRQAPSAVAVIESTTRVPSYNAQIFAHELGHNMGLVHDTARGFIMSPTSSALTYSTKFSPESMKLMDSMNLSKCFSSVRQMPNSNICGDGILDPAEECDPGLEEDDCCVNCKIDRPRCQCANSELCCERGQFKPASAVCRLSKNSECDQAEVCAGDSSQCPTDQYQPPTSSCRDLTGAQSNCYLGTCIPSRDAQCSLVNTPEIAQNPNNRIQQLSSNSRSCPTTRLCSRLHCSTSSDHDCSQVWSSSPANGSPCGPNGPTDTSHVCISGYCVASDIANSKSFVCLNQDPACIADDLSVLDTNYWVTLKILMVVMAVIVLAVFIFCCHKSRPLRAFRRRQRSGMQRIPMASQHMQPQHAPGG